MQKIKGVNIIGSPYVEDHMGIITFTVEGVHPHDIAPILDADGVNIRVGNHLPSRLRSSVHRCDC